MFLTIYAAPIALDEKVETRQELDKRVAHSGRGTWFYPGLGACGFTDTSSDPIVAISSQRWANGVNCNQWMMITNTANGKTAYGRTRDECPSCGADSIDMSPALFQQLGSLSTGVLQVTWDFEPMGWAPS